MNSLLLSFIKQKGLTKEWKQYRNEAVQKMDGYEDLKKLALDNRQPGTNFDQIAPQVIADVLQNDLHATNLTDLTDIDIIHYALLEFDLNFPGTVFKPIESEIIDICESCFESNAKRSVCKSCRLCQYCKKFRCKICD